MLSQEAIRNLLTLVSQRELSVHDALTRLRDLPYEDLGCARIDHHRELRRGFPEVIYCEGKTPQQVITAVARELVGFIWAIGVHVEAQTRQESQGHAAA